MISCLVVTFVKAEFMSSDILMHWYMVLRTQYMISCATDWILSDRRFYVLQIGFCLIEVQCLWFYSIGNDHATICPSCFFGKPLLNISWILLDIICEF